MAEAYSGPTAEEVVTLSEQLADEFYDQHEEDEKSRAVLVREHLVDVQEPEPGQEVKKIVTGYSALIVEQDFSFLTTPPFLRVNPLTPSQEAQAGKLETALAGMWMLSQGNRDVWLDMVYDYVWAGRGWSLICPVPELWGGELQREAGEEEAPYLDRVAQLKQDVFPIVWRSVPVEDTWPTRDIRGCVDKVVGIRKMKVRDIRNHYGETLLPRAGENSEETVIEYADTQWMCTVLKSETPTIVHAWYHGMGVNPYVLAEAPRSAPRSAKQQWQGALYHTRDLLKELDSLISDIRYNIKRAIHAQVLAKLDLEARAASPDGAGMSDTLNVRPNEAIVVDKDETVEHLSPAETNIDAYKLIEILQGLTKEVAVRSVLLGILGQGGQESGILYNTAAQFAQKQYGPAVSQLQKAAVGVGERFFKSIEVFADEGEDIPILYASADGKVERVGLKAKDVEGWTRALQARIDLAIPVNEAAEITNARLVTDPNNPLMSYETAVARYLHIENPLDEWKRILRTMIRQAIAPMISQVVTEAGLHLGTQDKGGDTELAGLFASLDSPVQQAIAAHAAQTGQLVPSGEQQGNLNRGAANMARDGRFQNSAAISQMGGKGAY